VSYYYGGFRFWDQTEVRYDHMRVRRRIFRSRRCYALRYSLEYIYFNSVATEQNVQPIDIASSAGSAFARENVPEAFAPFTWTSLLPPPLLALSSSSSSSCSFPFGELPLGPHVNSSTATFTRSFQSCFCFNKATALSASIACLPYLGTLPQDIFVLWLATVQASRDMTAGALGLSKERIPK